MVIYWWGLLKNRGHEKGVEEIVKLTVKTAGIRLVWREPEAVWGVCENCQTCVILSNV